MIISLWGLSITNQLCYTHILNQIDPQRRPGYVRLYNLEEKYDIFIPKNVSFFLLLYYFA